MQTLLWKNDGTGNYDAKGNTGTYRMERRTVDGFPVWFGLFTADVAPEVSIVVYKNGFDVYVIDALNEHNRVNP